MTTNTLVRHKKLTTLGIGCIAKVYKNQYGVNWGTEDTGKHAKSQLIPVDISKTKTVSFSEYKERILLQKSNLNNVIIGNIVQQFVGIGWINLRVVTEKDLLTLPRVVD